MDIQRLRARAAELIAKQRTHGLTEREVDECHEITRQVADYNAAQKSQKSLRDLAKLVGPHDVPVDGRHAGSPAHLPGVMEAFKELYPFAKGRMSASTTIRFKDSTNLDERQTSTQLIPGDYPTAGPSVLGLFPTESTTKPVERVYRTATEATAGIVAEGALKPDAGLTTEPYDVELVKIATTHKVTDELIEDQPSFFNSLPGELFRAVSVEENDYAINDATAGILNQSGLLTVTPVAGVSALDAIADAIASLYSTTDIYATAVVLNPLNLATIMKAKAGPEGQYLTDPFSANGTIHGLTPVVSNSVAQNTLLVSDFRQAGITYRRTPGINLATQTTEDDFQRNKVTMRVEERVALGITKPGHIVRITLS